MIIIQNIKPNKNPLGVCEYQVRINNRVVVNFKHKRSDGLGRCLIEAGNAVEREKWTRLAKELEKDLDFQSPL